MVMDGPASEENDSRKKTPSLHRNAPFVFGVSIQYATALVLRRVTVTLAAVALNLLILILLFRYCKFAYIYPKARRKYLHLIYFRYYLVRFEVTYVLFNLQ